MADDIGIVAEALREQYGRTIDHIGTHTELAERYVRALAAAGRIGDAVPDGEWQPTEDECLDIAHAAGGFVREWRAAEIAAYVLMALADAGRLLPRVDR